MTNVFDTSKEVEQAIHQKKPVVALESTIISHGMPWPANVETAMEVEEIVRKNGAVPATIAILNGKVHIGLEKDELEILGKANDVWKVSVRDMSYVMSQRKNGATTVAATMRLAAMAGIKIFVTGGIGGVHRGAEKSFDISADLFEMSRTNVAVVSAGVKSILDIGLTLEYLETLSVPVVTYRSDDFPSFYSRRSNYKTQLRLDDPLQIARMLNMKWSMGINGSVLIANPIQEKDEVPFEQIEKVILNTLSLAEEKGIRGKDVTPFLLKHIAEATKGESLNANIALIKNNAALGAAIAVAL